MKVNIKKLIKNASIEKINKKIMAEWVDVFYYDNYEQYNDKKQLLQKNKKSLKEELQSLSDEDFEKLIKEELKRRNFNIGFWKDKYKNFKSDDRFKKLELD